MKRIMVFLTLSLLAISCGTEEVATRFAAEDNLVSNTALKEKLMRVTQHPTAVDDFIDECSCFSVKMPYTVYVNSAEVTVNSEEDYQQVYDILIDSNYDYDFITFLYPITVVYADYHEEELDVFQYMDAVVACAATETEIACIDLVFPVGIKTYDSQNVLAESFEVGTKQALYGFLSTVEAYDAAVFAYPLGFIKPDETIQTVAGNTALEAAIDTYTEECDGLIYPSGSELTEAITQGTWRVSYYYNDADLTYNYTSYNFTFEEDYTISFTGFGEGITGYWNYGISGGYEAFALYGFSSSELFALEQIWMLTNTTDTQINLYLPGSGTVPPQYLQFTKN